MIYTQKTNKALYKINFLYRNIKSMAGSGQRIVAGREKALELLRELPRISLANLKSNPKAFPHVILISS